MNNPRVRRSSICASLLSLLTFLLLHSVGYCDSTVFFLRASTNTAGTNPYSIATGDFNADGKADFVTANYDEDTITVGLGKGDGTFHSLTNYNINPLPPYLFAGLARVVTADVNGDGRSDVLVTYGYDAGHVAVFTATNGGQLIRQADVVASSYCDSISFADFNADGHIDMAVAGADVTVHFGDGNGAFPTTTVPTTGLPLGKWVTCVTAADVNKDGRPDLLVGSYVQELPSVLIFLGQANGSFLMTTNITVYNDEDPATRAITVGDYNGDGLADLAIGFEDEPAISIVLQTAGGFSVFTNYVVSAESFYCVTADFNGDGYADLATPNDLLLGKGNGEFLLARPVEYGWAGNSLAIADANGDGRPDMLWSTGYAMCSTNNSRPTLRIEKTNGHAQLSWPTWNAFSLLSTTNLAFPANKWTAYTNNPTRSRAAKKFPDLTLRSPGGRYFRLLP